MFSGPIFIYLFSYSYGVMAVGDMKLFVWWGGEGLYVVDTVL